MTAPTAGDDATLTICSPAQRPCLCMIVPPPARQGAHKQDLANVQRCAGGPRARATAEARTWTGDLGRQNSSGNFSWRLKLKKEGSTTPGLQADSQVPRFDARLDTSGTYVNPFTGARGNKSVGTHIPLNQQWIP